MTGMRQEEKVERRTGGAFWPKSDMVLKILERKHLFGDDITGRTQPSIKQVAVLDNWGANLERRGQVEGNR
jgi:hypothetical protein